MRGGTADGAACNASQPRIAFAARGHVGNRACQDAEIVERSGLNFDALQRQDLMRRHVADHAAVRGRPDGRTDSLRSDCDRDHEIGDSGGRSRRRATGRVLEIMRVGGTPGRHRGKLRRDGLAEDDRAGPPEHSHASCIGNRNGPLVDRRAMLGRHVVRVYNVFDRDWNAVQSARKWPRVGVGGLRQRSLRSEVSKGPHVLFTLGNAIKTCLEVIGRREGAASDLFECSRRVVSIDPRDRHRTCLPRFGPARHEPNWETVTFSASRVPL